MASTTVSRETRKNTFEAAVAMSLHLWQPLSFAVESNLGGGDGADKRDWFAGAVAELFEDAWANVDTASSASSSAAAAAARASATATTATDDDLLMDVEARLLQIMDDEFDTVVDDGTAYDVAEQIVGLWKQCRRGDLAGAAALRQRWEAARGKRVAGLFRAGPAPDDDSAWQTDDEDDEDDGDDDSGDDDDGDDKDQADVDMAEAPGLVEAQGRTKKPPQVDEDGFTQVTRKKR